MPALVSGIFLPFLYPVPVEILGKSGFSLSQALVVIGLYAFNGFFYGAWIGVSSGGILCDYVISILAESGGVIGQGGSSSPVAFGGVLCLEGGRSSTSNVRTLGFGVSSSLSSQSRECSLVLIDLGRLSSFGSSYVPRGYYTDRVF